MFSLILAVAVLTIVILFSVQNAGPVAVSFLSWRLNASLAMVIALSLFGGMILGMAALSWIRLRRTGRKKKAAESAPRHDASGGGR